MILDTSFVIDLLRGKPKAVDKLKELEEKGEPLYVTAPTIYELYLGIQLSKTPRRERARIEEALEGQPVLPLDAKAAQLAGKLQGELMSRGQPIDPVDALVAGVAVANQEAMVTRNVKHFERMEGLSVEGY